MRSASGGAGKYLLAMLCAWIAGYPLTGALSVSFEQPLLEPHAIADVNIQLRDDADIAGYEDVEYVDSLSDCRDEVSARIDTWIASLGLAPSSLRKQANRVRVVVPVDEPRRGDMIILYRVFIDKSKAFLEIMFDSNERLEPAELEILNRKYSLTDLKKALIARMKCSGS